MACGTLVPFMKELALPGDTFDIDLDVDIKTHPTIGPLFGSFKVQLDVFQAPVRLYHSALHNNAIGIGMKMNTVKLPQLTLVGVRTPRSLNNIDNLHTSPSSLLAYLDIRGIGSNITVGNNISRDFNGIPYLAYWDIYKNYYANKQEEIGACLLQNPTIENYNGEASFANPALAFPQGINSMTGNPQRFSVGTTRTITFTFTGTFPSTNIVIQTDSGEYTLFQLFNSIVESGTSPRIIAGQPRFPFLVKGWYPSEWNYTKDVPDVSTFPLENIDKMREKILALTPTQQLRINSTDLPPYRNSFLFDNTGGQTIGTTKRFSTQGGQNNLALKTYQSDLFNNWMSTEWIDGTNGINAITAVDTSDGNFTIDQLQLAKKVYDMLNRIAISGGTYDDWLDAVYTHDRFRSAESPIYEGGLMTDVFFQEVISNSESGSEGFEQPLGTLAGRGISGSNRKGGKLVVKVDEPSYLMGIISLTPRVDYSQGNKWDTSLKTMDDFHKPALDQIGFQDLITEQMAWYDTSIADNNAQTKHSAGKQPAWINYMTNVNVTRGNFAIEENEMFMTLNRKYERDEVTGGIKDLTTYIDPRKFNNIFAHANRDAQNFWVQIGVDITARRKMSAKVMPNL